MKNTCLRYPRLAKNACASYTPFGSLLSWYVGDAHTRRIGWLIDVYCKIFRLDPTLFHGHYPK
ncbi:MAG: hypothetical protein WC346_10850 [Methanogenium sp.]|jgi:hypothetical protein